MNSARAAALLLIGALLAPGCTSREEEQIAPSKLAADMARYAPTVITADTTALSRGDRMALASLAGPRRTLDRLRAIQVDIAPEFSLSRP